MPMDSVINLYYGQIISPEIAEEYPMKYLNKTIHKIPNSYKDPDRYIIGFLLKLDYEKLQKISDENSPLYKFKG
jgi:hypothetical protein